MKAATHRSPKRALATLALAAALLASPIAAIAGDPAGTPAPSAFAVDGEVHAVAHAGGRTYIGGNFDEIGPRVGNGAAFQATGASAGSLPGDWPAIGTADFPEVAGGAVKAAVADDGGGWFIGGSFTHVAGVARAGLAHITAAGRLDGGWVAGANDDVLALALDRLGNLYVGGRFTEITGTGGATPRSHLAALSTADATVAGDFRPDPDDVVRALKATAVQVEVTEGDPPATRTETNPVVIAGGDFTEFPGEPTTGDDYVVMIWGPGAVGRAGEEVGGVPVASSSGTPANGPVRALEIGDPIPQTDESGDVDWYLPVYIGGEFTAPQTNAAAHRLLIPDVRGSADAIGSVSMSNRSGWTPNPNAPVDTVLLKEGTVYLGGSFTTLNPSSAPAPRRGLGAVAAVPGAEIATTSNCTSTCPATLREWEPEATDEAGNPARVRSLAGVDGGGSIIAGGPFERIGNEVGGSVPARSGAAALVPDGLAGEGDALAFDPGLAGGEVEAVALAADGAEGFVGGSFNIAGAVPRTNLAALDSDGALDGGFAANADAKVLALEAGPDALYVGGLFSKIRGAARGRIAALDPASGAVVGGWNPGVGPCAPGAGCADPPPTAVFALELTAEQLFVGGDFSELAAAERRSLGAVHPVGSSNAGQASGFDPRVLRGDGGVGQVRALAASCTAPELPGDVIYAGGTFATAGGAERSRLAALSTADGTANQATGWDARIPSGTVFALDLTADRSTVYAAGSFGAIGGEVRHNLAALSAANGDARAWNPAPDVAARAVALTGDERTVIAGGSFTEAGGESRNRLAALQAHDVGDGSGDVTGWNPGPDGTVRAIDVSADNAFVGGEFASAAGRAQGGWAPFIAGADGDEAAPPPCKPPAKPPQPPPAVTIESGPEGVIAERDASFGFSFSEPAQQGASFECRLDGGAYEACTPPRQYAGLENGLHTFAVRGVDPTGTEHGPVSERSWVVDVPNPGRCSNMVRGTAERDELIGSDLGEVFLALRGDDVVKAGRGGDCVDGGEDNDRVKGGDGRDILKGGKDFDVLAGGRGRDILKGGKGRDILKGGKGRDRLKARDGRRDKVFCGRGRDVAVVDRKDRVRGCEKVKRRRKCKKTGDGQGKMRKCTGKKGKKGRRPADGG